MDRINPNGAEFDMTNEEVDRICTNARKHPVLILDLRGNPAALWSRWSEWWATYSATT
jgi:hypothetical protein